MSTLHEEVPEKPDDVAGALWSTPAVALGFLMHTGLVMLPLRCAKGHEWRAYFRGGVANMECKASERCALIDVDEDKVVNTRVVCKAPKAS